MADHLDLDAHRRTLTERLNSLKADLDHTTSGSLALHELTMLLHQVLDNVEERVALQKAELDLFQKLVLSGVRLSGSWEEYQERCLNLEEQLGFFKKP